MSICHAVYFFPLLETFLLLVMIRSQSQSGKRMIGFLIFLEGKFLCVYFISGFDYQTLYFYLINLISGLIFNVKSGGKWNRGFSIQWLILFATVFMLPYTNIILCITLKILIINILKQFTGQHLNNIHHIPWSWILAKIKDVQGHRVVKSFSQLMTHC